MGSQEDGNPTRTPMMKTPNNTLISLLGLLIAHTLSLLPLFPPTCLSLTALTSDYFYLVMNSFHPQPCVPCADFGSPTTLATVSSFQFDKEDNIHDPDVGTIHNYDGFSFDPSCLDLAQRKGNLLMWSLLKSMDSLSYMGNEFKNHHTPSTATVKFLLGKELVKLEVTTYGYEYMLELCEGMPPVTSFNSYNVAGPMGTQEWIDT